MSSRTFVPDPATFEVGGMSDVGQIRTVNQDSCGVFEDAVRGRRLLIVADGMGGHLGGDVASRMTVETVREAFAQGGEDPAAILRQAFEEANTRVHEAAKGDAELTGMGTTGVSMLFQTGGQGWVAHVGDSRAYRLRGGTLRQITEDHSVVGALVRMGRITEQEAKLHPQRNEILRAIGTNDSVDVQITPLGLEPGDRYLLCSDGLSDLVDDDEIAAVLMRATIEDAVRILVERANELGGSDNITVQAVHVPGEPTDADAARAPVSAGHPDESSTESFEVVRVEPDDATPVWVWALGAAGVALVAWLLFR